MAGMLCLAFLIRIAAFISIKNSIYYDYMLWDEKIYHHLAVQILNGTWNSKAVYEFAPLPAYFMALLYKIFTPDINILRVANVFFGALTCLFTGLVGFELKGKRTAVFAFAVSVFYTPFIFYSVVPLKTSLSVFLFSVFVWFFFKAMNYPSRLWLYAVLGVFIGMMVNIRPNYLVVVPIVYLFLIVAGYFEAVSVKKICAGTLILTTGFILAISPFVLRNYIVTGKTALTPSQTGFNLFIGNNPDNKIPYYRPVSFASSSPIKQGIQFNIEASRRAGKSLSAQEASSFWSKVVVEYAVNQPDAFFYKILQKTLIFFNRFEAGDHYHIGFMGDHVNFFRLPMIGFWVILPFGIVGLIVGFGKNKKISAGTLIFLVYGLSLIIFFCNTRYRLPMLVILIPAAVYGIEKLILLAGQKRYKKMAFLFSVAIVFFIIEFLPVTGTDDVTAYYNTHAVVLKNKGRIRDAIQYWEISSKMNKPFSAFANLSLARFYRSKGDPGKSKQYLNMISKDSFAVSHKYSMQGDHARNMGDMKKAVYYYRKSLQINYGEREVWKKLITTLNEVDRSAISEEIEKYKTILDFYR